MLQTTRRAVSTAGKSEFLGEHLEAHQQDQDLEQCLLQSRHLGRLFWSIHPTPAKEGVDWGEDVDTTEDGAETGAKAKEEENAERQKETGNPDGHRAEPDTSRDYLLWQSPVGREHPSPF